MPRPLVGTPVAPRPARPATPSGSTGSTTVTAPPLGAGTSTGSFASTTSATGMGPLSGRGATVSLTGTAAKRVNLDEGIFLTSSGYFVDRPGQERPASSGELGAVLSKVAQRSNRGENVFSRRGVTLAHRQAAFKQLGEALKLGREAANFGGNADQALETRASAAPLLLDLALSLDPAQPAEQALLAEAMAAYQKALEQEPHGLLRTFMLFDLDRAKGKLPQVYRVGIDQQMREVAPLTPPYEEWFKDGNSQLKLHYYVGAGFWGEEQQAFLSAGFTQRDNPDGTVSLIKHYEVEQRHNDGTSQKVLTDVELVMHNGSDGMFEHMSDPNTAGVVYSGHANYGREVPSHLDGSPQMQGAKVFFSLQCGGKGVHNALLEKFPDLHVVSSKNSSYGHQDRSTMLNTLEGISRRLPWAQISAQNASRNSSNYYFPSDTLISRRAQDRDRDGNIDAWDRVLSVSAFHPKADIAAQLTPADSKRPARELDGHAVTGAVLRFWRMAGYNTWAEKWQDQGVLPRGFFEGRRSDPLFRTREVVGEDGSSVLELTVNSQYAHASEEVLGAAMHYELGKMAARQAGLSEAESKAAGLLMAAKALDIDNGSADEAVWETLLRFEGLPGAITLHDAMDANHGDEAHPAGSPQTLRHFLETLKQKNIDLAAPPR